MHRSAITVCVVEPDESARRALVRFMQAEGFRTLSFRSPVELLASAELKQTGCVIAGGQTPGEGASLPGALRARGLGMPVILLAACETEHGRAEAKRAGVAAVFLKPVDGQALVDAIGWVLSGPDAGETAADSGKGAKP